MAKITYLHLMLDELGDIVNPRLTSLSHNMLSVQEVKDIMTAAKTKTNMPFIVNEDTAFFEG